MRIVSSDESLAAAEQTQLGIGIEAAVAHPASEKKILSRESIAADGVRVGDRCANLIRQGWTDFFIGVEQQDPIFRTEIDRVLLLGNIAAPGFDDHARSAFARDLASPVFRAGIDENDLVSPGHTRQGAADVGLFVHRHDGYGDRHCQWKCTAVSTRYCLTRKSSVAGRRGDEW